MLPIILITIYIVGIIVFMKIQKKYFPYKYGEDIKEFDGYHTITPESYKVDLISSSILWPIFSFFLIILILLTYIQNNNEKSI